MNKFIFYQLHFLVSSIESSWSQKTGIIIKRIRSFFVGRNSPEWSSYSRQITVNYTHLLKLIIRSRKGICSKKNHYIYGTPFPLELLDIKSDSLNSLPGNGVAPVLEFRQLLISSQCL